MGGKPGEPSREANIASTSASSRAGTGWVWGHRGIIRTPLATAMLLHLQPQGSKIKTTFYFITFTVFAGLYLNRAGPLIPSAWATACPQPSGASWPAHLGSVKNHGASE